MLESVAWEGSTGSTAGAGSEGSMAGSEGSMAGREGAWAGARAETGAVNSEWGAGSTCCDEVGIAAGRETGIGLGLGLRESSAAWEEAKAAGASGMGDNGGDTRVGSSGSGCWTAGDEG